MTQTGTPLFHKAKMIEHLSEVVSVIQERGWCRGMLTNHDTGAVCIVGAHNVAVDARDEDDVWSQLEFARALGFDSIEQVVMWNDFKAEDQDDVMEFILQRIERIVQTA